MTTYKETFMDICHRRNTTQGKAAAACGMSKNLLLLYLDVPTLQPIGMVDVLAGALRCTPREHNGLWDAYRQDIWDAQEE